MPATRNRLPNRKPYQTNARYWMRIAIKRAGTAAKLGAAIGVSQQAVSYAKRFGLASGELAVAIHHWSEGEIGAHRIRPDLWTAAEHVPPRPKQPAYVIVHPKVVSGSS